MKRNEGYSVKREIINTVIDLLAKKSYMEITVTEIIKASQVARASFYRNFNSVSDVIDAIVDDLSDDFLENVYPVISGREERAWRDYLFSHFYHFQGAHRKIEDIHPQNLSLLFARIDGRIQEKGGDLPSGTIGDKYTVIGKMGLINNITKKWMDDGMKETPEEMVDYLMSFITSF